MAEPSVRAVETHCAIAEWGEPAPAWAYAVGIIISPTSWRFVLPLGRYTRI